MDDTFVALATLVRGREAAARASACGPAPVERERRPVAPQACVAYATELNDLAIMRVAALEAFEGATKRLLEALAREVLARELRLAAADVATLIERALAAFSDAEPVDVVVSPSDADALRERLSLPLPIRVDASLDAGDLIVNVRNGSFESPVSFRFDAVVAAAVEGSGP